MELSELSSYQEASLFLLWFGGMAGGSASIDLRSDIDLPERKGEATGEL